MTELPDRVTIREVGPRDGLQSEKPLPVEDRVRLIEALSETGVPRLEAVSFVSPKAVPAMADAAAVWRRVRKVSHVEYSALVPNRRGAEDAVRASGFASLQAFLATADGYNRKNVGKSVDESIADVAEVVGVAEPVGLPVEVSISTSFGDPYEGDVVPARVLEVAERVLDAGAQRISLADTTGMATPTRIWEVVGLLQQRLPDAPINLHLHDTRGTAMANMLAAMQIGITEFDASIGGLGGSPFAPGANGNLATEDVVHMLSDMGVETGIDLDRVLAAASLLESLVGHRVNSQVTKAGPRWVLASR
ncbi:MAG: hydroxymethylglutaryl-CoA lyase [Actinobacteria bacterium]|nr:hydroxymethylglutaryl-CoA lyase [Actinomycetota bacterium]